MSSNYILDMYSTGFIPITLNKLRKQQGLQSQLLSNNCNSNIILVKKPSINCPNKYPIPAIGLGYGNQVSNSCQCLSTIEPP